MTRDTLGARLLRQNVMIPAAFKCHLSSEEYFVVTYEAAGTFFERCQKENRFTFDWQRWQIKIEHPDS